MPIKSILRVPFGFWLELCANFDAIRVRNLLRSIHYLERIIRKEKENFYNSMYDRVTDNSGLFTVQGHTGLI
jgi:hypothetical protein